MTSEVFPSNLRPPVIGQENMSSEQGVEKPPLPPKPTLEVVPENESPKSPKLSEKPPLVETSPPTGTGSETSRSYQPEGNRISHKFNSN